MNILLIISNIEFIILSILLCILLIGFIIYMIWMIKTIAKNRKEARKKLFTQEYPLAGD